MDPETPTLQEYAWMALDAYDYRDSEGNVNSSSPADPEFADRFEGWVHEPEGSLYGRKNSTMSFGNGLDFNVYRNDDRQEIVVAFRGTELSQFLALAEDLQFRLINDLDYDNDVASLFGYWTDGGATIESFVNGQGGLEAFLINTFDVSANDADAAVDALNIIDDRPFDGGVDAIAAKGEESLLSMARQATASVLEVAADNPGYQVTLTGHSLGGALAAYAAAALGVPAQVFDPAPWANNALLGNVRALADDLLATTYAGLDTAQFGWEALPNIVQTAADKVSTVRIAESFVPPLYLTADPGDLPAGEGTEEVIELTAPGLTGLARHAMDLHTLVLDSRVKETDDRPSLETLADDLPRLLERIQEGSSVSPLDQSPETFMRNLLVSEPFYELFAATMERIEAESDAFAPTPDGADALDLEVALIDRALVEFGLLVATADTGPGRTDEDILGEADGSPGDDAIVGEHAVANIIRPGLGADFVATGGGIGAGDTIIGSPAQLDGDTIWDFSREDRFVFEGATFGSAAVTKPGAQAALAVDADGDGVADAAIFLEDAYLESQIRVREVAEGTEITFLPEGGAISVEDAQNVALIYEAGLDRAGDIAGINFWIDAREDGLSERGLAQAFLSSSEFAATVGDPETLTNRALVEGLYRNVLDRDGEEAGVDFWTAQLDAPAFTEEALLLAFAYSAENRGASPEIETLAETAPGFWDFQPVA